MKNLLLVALTLLVCNTARSQGFQPDDVVISDTTTGFLDPEFVRYKDSLFTTFVLSNGNVWVGFVDPNTGLFPVNFGKNRYVGGPWAPISVITNGPEWGLTVQGPRLYFTKMKTDGKSGLFQYPYPFVNFNSLEIPLDSGFSYGGPCGSFYPGFSEPYLWFYRGQLNAGGQSWQSGTARNAWQNTQTGVVTELDKSPVAVIRWAYQTPYIVYAHTVNGTRQIFILNTLTGVSEQATFDAGDKIDPWGFYAPEYDGAFCLMANIDNRYLRLYRNDDGVWAAADSLALPRGDNPDTLMTSVEPVYGGQGAAGNSYFTVQAYNAGNDYTSIWLLGWGDRLQRRLDEGATSGALKQRFDPESILGANELFVYYSEQSATSRLHRCKTGIFLNNNPTTSYALYPDIPYHSEPGVDTNLLSLDVYQPDNPTGPLPVMIYIHGGYWNAGDKAHVGQRAQLFTDSGYVFVSINYRLSPDPVDTLSPDAVRFPTHPEDCARAVRWVYNHIGAYGGDSSRISLIGHSAGAHLALLLSTNEAFLENEGLSLTQIKCACSLDAGVFDVAEELEQAGAYIPRRAPLINAFGTDPALYDDASPQYHIQAGKYLPWLHLVHQNTNDRLYAHHRFRDSLLANGHTRVSLFNAAPYNHGQINANLGSPLDSIGETTAVMAFFGDCLQYATTGAMLLTGSDTAVRLFPNPANANLTVSGLPDGFNGHVVVYDAMGQILWTGPRAGAQFSLPTVYLQRGVYFLQLRADNGQATTLRFVKN